MVRGGFKDSALAVFVDVAFAHSICAPSAHPDAVGADPEGPATISWIVVDVESPDATKAEKKTQAEATLSSGKTGFDVIFSRVLRD